MKTFVFGIDGATFRLIEKWKEKLPNFNKLLRSSVVGDLKSTTPPHTALAWPSLLTGVNPGKHGIFQFWKPQIANYGQEYYQSSDIRYKTIDQLFNEQGKKAGMVNIPMTHPPESIDGFRITWPLFNTLNYTYPKNLGKDLLFNKVGFPNDLVTMYKGEDNYDEKAKKYLSNRSKSLEYLYKNYEWDLFFCVITEIDRISHNYWRYMEDKEQLESKKNAVFDVYKEVDNIIGDIIKNLDSNTIFAIVSDHGFIASKSNFYIHKFLIDNNYMKIDNSHDNEGNGWYLDRVDWGSTKAYMPAPGCYGLNINLKGRQDHGIVSRNEFDQLCEEICELLMRVKDDNNNNIFKAVLPNEVVYLGEESNQAPDLILIPNSYELMVHHSIGTNELFGIPDQSGFHDMDGILILNGPMFKEGIITDCFAVEDFLPTILYALNLEIPNDIDGRIIEHIFKDNFLKNSVPKYGYSSKKKNNYTLSSTYSKEDKKNIEDQLKVLGYL
ncbi:alkaline phosphatase family protein [Cytobacillus kochii]|uniref:alkaline phosphatase family protein n=1 Tax=Cytobacillus kochii TaxID=859143 RepID=UPI001CD53D24|nr:alkaline phosphatase family protein [Cytobacillus kochii]MCA1028636.1 alkaline phosphatase family protein [Cytobacillus kochii]